MMLKMDPQALLSYTTQISPTSSIYNIQSVLKAVCALFPKHLPTHLHFPFAVTQICSASFFQVVIHRNAKYKSYLGARYGEAHLESRRSSGDRGRGISMSLRPVIRTA